MIRLSSLVRPLRASLRYRLALSIALVHAVMMAIFVFDLTDQERDLLIKQTQQKAITSAMLLSRSSQEWVLSRDLAGLGELIKPFDETEGIEFALVTDREGRVLAHSQPDRIGLYLNDSISRTIIADTSTSPRIVQDTPTLIDAVAPIERGGVIMGWSRIGVNQSGTTAAMNQAARHGLLYTLAAILLGTLLALMIASDLTRDFRRVQQLFARIGEGALDQRIAVHRGDELGSLMLGLNGMLERLQDDERLLKETRERLELAMHGSNDGLWDWNLKTNQVYFSRRWKAMLGYGDEEVGTDLEEWSSRVHPDDIATTSAGVQAHIRGETPAYENIHRMRHKDGRWLWILDRGLAIRDAQGEPYRMVGTHTDITRRIELEHSLSEQKERLGIVLKSMADGVIVTNSAGKVEFINPAAEALTGWTLAEAMDQPLDRVAQFSTDDMKHPLNADRLHAQIHDGLHEFAARLLHRGDIKSHAEIELNVSLIQAESGEDGLVLILHDVSKTHRMLEQMSWQATHDPLTRLPNRLAFGDRLKTLLDGARLGHERHVLLYMDLDQFKLVNDTCGHHAGDELLTHIGHILRSSVRRDDMIARLGGDEFAGLLPHCSLDAAEWIANKLREGIQNFSFHWQDRVFNVGVSIGIVSIGPEWDSAEDILRAADIACYAAKEEGRNRLHVYKLADEATSRRVEQLGMAAQIQLALREDRFVLYAQPIKHLPLPVSDDGLHLEVLVRMLGREGKIIAPGLFIGAAERYNHMQALDRWVISATLARIHLALTTPGSPPLRHVGINLSGNSLTDEGMMSFVEEAIRRYQFPAGLICFEITETAVISNMHKALAFIDRMKASGCTFALDDFGSGLSSFAYLKALPVDYLKIDGVFVRDIESDSRDRAFVQAIHQVGRTLGLKTVAEFVENAAIERILREMGVDYAQGYGISPPRPLDDLLAPAGNTPATRL